MKALMKEKLNFSAFPPEDKRVLSMLEERGGYNKSNALILLGILKDVKEGGQDKEFIALCKSALILMKASKE